MLVLDAFSGEFSDMKSNIWALDALGDSFTMKLWYSIYLYSSAISLSFILS
jgi:hypothetical protein